MRSALVVAVLLVAIAPAAQASGSRVELTGPDSVAAERPATILMTLTLVLDNVGCFGESDIPVSLDISAREGVRSVALGEDEIRFVPPPTGATGAWRGAKDVELTVWGEQTEGRVEVTAAFALPAGCASVGGERNGFTTYSLRVDGPPPPEPPGVLDAQPTTAAPKSESYLEPAPDESHLRSIELRKPPLPGPVMAAMLATLVGAAMVLAKRLRKLL